MPLGNTIQHSAVWLNLAGTPVCWEILVAVLQQIVEGTSNWFNRDGEARSHNRPTCLGRADGSLWPALAAVASSAEGSS